MRDLVCESRKVSACCKFAPGHGLCQGMEPRCGSRIDRGRAAV